MYKVVYHKRVRKQLKKLPESDRLKIAKKIKALQINPLNPSLDIAPYYDSKKSWRVRAGDLRAIYTFDTKAKIVYLLYLGYRGNIY